MYKQKDYMINVPIKPVSELMLGYNDFTNYSSIPTKENIRILLDFANSKNLVHEEINSLISLLFKNIYSEQVNIISGNLILPKVNFLVSLHGINSKLYLIQKGEKVNGGYYVYGDDNKQFYFFNKSGLYINKISGKVNKGNKSNVLYYRDDYNYVDIAFKDGKIYTYIEGDKDYWKVEDSDRNLFIIDNKTGKIIESVERIK